MRVTDSEDSLSATAPRKICSGSAEQVIEELSQRFPQAAPILKATRLAHEDEYVEKQTVLTGGAEYCLIPPVSGG